MLAGGVDRAFEKYPGNARKSSGDEDRESSRPMARKHGRPSHERTTLRHTGGAETPENRSAKIAEPVLKPRLQLECRALTA